MRLDKFIVKSTVLSRDAARAKIAAGAVLVNGLVMTEARQQVHENNLIELDGLRLKPRASRYLMLHKPASTICSNIDEAYPSLFHYLDLPQVEDLHIAGRLDADTTGMVLITDDGRWSFAITQPSRLCPKVYRVSLSSPLAPHLPAVFKQGIQLQGESQLTQPALLDIMGPKDALLTITEGKFHQVKRMFASVGNRVVALHRQQMGSLTLDLAEGEWRYLSEAEVLSFVT